MKSVHRQSPSSWDQQQSRITIEGGRDTVVTGFVYGLIKIWDVITFGHRQNRARDKFIAEFGTWSETKFAEYLHGKGVRKHYSHNPYGHDSPGYSVEQQEQIILGQFPLYRFSAYKSIMRDCSEYASYIFDLEREIDNGKKFTVEGCLQGEFEDIVRGMARGIRNERRRAKQAEQEQERLQRKKIDRQARYRTHVSECMQQEAQEISEYCQLYEERIALEEADSCIKKRHRALALHQQGQDVWTDHYYRLPQPVGALLQEHSISLKEYRVVYGNQLQHALHAEFLEILTNTADLHYQENQEDLGGITTTLTRFTHAGSLYNQAGKMPAAIQFADFCRGMLSSIKAIGELTIEVGQFGIDLTSAAWRGSNKGAHNVFDKASHPIETLQNIKRDLFKLGDFVRGYLYEMHQKHVLDLEQTKQVLLDLATGNMTLQEYKKLSMQGASSQEFRRIIQQAPQALTYICNQLNRKNVLNTVEKGSEIVTEMALTHATCSALGSLFGNASNYLGTYGGDIGNTGFFPLTINSMQAPIALDGMALAQERAIVSIVCDTIAENLDAASILAPPILFSAENSNDMPSNARTGGAPLVLPPNPEKDVLEVAKRLSDNEITEFAKNYDGIVDYNGVPIKIDYRHFFECKAAGKNGTKLAGLHHDFNGFLRKQGLIRNIRMHLNGFYKAEVYYNGKWIEKSFFPENWTLNEVVESVLKAFKNSIVEKTNGIRSRLIGVINERVKLLTIIEDGTGHMITGYPRILE